MKLNKKSLLYGTLILTSANFFVRILGFIYRILLSRTLGAQGMGLFQLVFPVYLISVAVTASGIPVAVSKLVAEYRASGRTMTARKVVSVSLFLVISLSMVISFILILNIDFISKCILGDERTVVIIYALLPCISISGICSVIKGYFYGIKNIHPPALSEIIEQMLRMSLVILILYKLYPLEYEQASAIAAFGMSIGELASVLFLWYRYKKPLKKYNYTSKSDSSVSLLLKITVIAVPITVTRLISSAMNATNSILIPKRLIISGIEANEAISVFGIMSGMVMPLLFLPFTLTSALSMVIIPNLSENVALNNWSDIRNKISKALFLTSLTALPSSAVLIALSNPIGNILYKEPEVGKYLIVPAFFLLFFCIQHCTNGIMNGLGKQNRAAIHFIIGGIIQITCTYFLVCIPEIRIYGFIVGFGASSILISLLNLSAIVRSTSVRIKFIQWFIEPALASIAMGLTAFIIYHYLIKSNFSDILALLLSALSGTLVFLIYLFFNGSFSFVTYLKMFKLFPARRVKK